MKNKIYVAASIALLILLIYTPVILYPYLLADSNWIVRGLDAGYPTLNYISLTQGRPVFAGIIWLSRYVTSNLTHIDAIRVTELSAISLFTVWAISFYYWLKPITNDSIPRILVVVGLSTMPAFQMFIFGGPWLSVGLVSSIIASFYIKASLESQGSQRLNKQIISTLLMVFCWSLYQPIPLMILGYFVFLWTNSFYQINKSNDVTVFNDRVQQIFKEFTAVVILLLISLLIYTLLWWCALQLAPQAQDTRYSLTSIDFLSVGLKLTYFITERLPQAMNLWSIAGVKTSMWFWLSSFFLLIFIERLFQASKKLGNAYIARVILAFLLFLLVLDLSAFMGKEPNIEGRPILSFMTLAPLTLGIFSFVFVGIISSHRPTELIGRVIPSYSDLTIKRIWSTILLIILAIFVLYGHKATRTFVLPIHREYLAIANAVKLAACPSQQPVVLDVKLVTNNSFKYKEFGWKSFDGSFYTFWLANNVLDDLQVKIRKPIIIRDSRGIPVSGHSDVSFDRATDCIIKVNH